MCFTETWLNESVPDCLFNLPNYTFYRMDRTGRQGGGVCMYVKSPNDVERLFPSNHPEFFESVWCVDRTKRFLIVTFYIPPDVALAKFKDVEEFIIDVLDDYLRVYPNFDLILNGDFNKMPIENLCLTFHVQNIVHEPTRCDSLLDLILVSNDIVNEFEVVVGPPIGKSDHRTLKCSSKYMQSRLYRKRTPNYCKVTNFDLGKDSVANFLASLATIDFRVLYRMESLEEKTHFFSSCSRGCNTLTKNENCVFQYKRQALDDCKTQGSYHEKVECIP